MKSAALVFALGIHLYSGLLNAACADGVQPSGAKYRICLPNGAWNRQLLVYAHGYVSADKPVAIPEDQLTLPDGTSLPDSFNALGYAFAVSSYRTNGLAAIDAQDDLIELTQIFTQKVGKPDATFLGGVSEGGLVATLSAEKFPRVYDAAIAACGPIGSFSGQINYIGDARVLFDYYFPGVLPGSVISVPPQLAANWTVYIAAIKSALAANPAKTEAFLNASQIPKASDPAVTGQNVVDTLNYSAMATNDAFAKLKGQPFDNRYKYYFGSTNDFELNSKIPRYAADAAAVQNMKLYDTTGKPQIPLVTLHTTADPVVPYSHEIGYFIKTLQTGSLSKVNQIPVFRNGHCAFEPGDILWAFIVMLAQKRGTSPASIIQELPAAQQKMLPSSVRTTFAIR